MLQKYPLLCLCPLNIVSECFHLNLLAPRDGIKEIEKSTNYTKQHERQRTSSNSRRLTQFRGLRLRCRRHECSWLCDDLCQTLCIPDRVNVNLLFQNERKGASSLLVTIELSQLHQSHLLISQGLWLIIVSRCRGYVEISSTCILLINTHT